MAEAAPIKNVPTIGTQKEKRRKNKIPFTASRE
jgi:hypothetical protein